MKNYLLSLCLLMIYAIPISAGVTHKEDITSEESVLDEVYGKYITGNLKWYYENSRLVSDFGIYTFPLYPQNNTLQLTQLYEHVEKRSGYFNGVLIEDNYVLTSYFDDPGDGQTSHYFHTYDLATMTLKAYKRISEKLDLTGLAYDVTEKELYGINYLNLNVNGVSVFSHYLYQADHKEGTATMIEKLDITAIAITFDTKGQLYAIDRDAKVYKMNKFTGEATLIGETGVGKIENNSVGFCYDEDTDKYYWVANFERSSGLYEIDINTGKASLIQQFPNRELFTGLFVTENIHKDAPAAVTDLEFRPIIEGDLQGRIHFTVPDKTENNKNLTENLSGTLTVSNDGSVIEVPLVNLVPGSSYTGQQIVLDEEGFVVYKIVLRNQAGQSRTVIERKWVGTDTPSAISRVILSKDQDESPFISWEEMIIGKHDGYIDPALVRYKIIRYPDNIVIASELTETTYKDESIEGEMQFYSYGVIAYYPDGREGKETKTKEMIFGASMTVPFNHEITGETSNYWTVVDANRDGKSWSLVTNSEDAMVSPTNVVQDEWLFSPPLQLEPGGIYKIKFLMTTPSPYESHNFKITYGNQMDPASQKTLKEYPNYINYSRNPISEEETLILELNEGGTTYIGFHCYAQTATWAVLQFREISIELAALPESPGVVDNLTISYGEKGSKPASISFKTPTKNTIGDELTSLNKIEIYRNDFDSPAHTIDNPQMGQTINWIDEGVSEGSNHYRIVAVNEIGAGLIAMDSVFIGLDLPAEVRNLQLIRNNQDNAQLSWEAPLEGMHQGYIEEVVYKIKKNDSEVLVSSQAETSYTDREVSKTQQTILSYTVIPFYEDQPNNEGQKSASNTVRFGPVYTLPYEESFAAAKETRTGWSKEYLEIGEYEWSIVDKSSYCNPQDEDGGMIVWKVTVSGNAKMAEQRLITPMLDFSNIELPLLRFWFYHYELNRGDTDHINLLISLDEGETFTTIQDTAPIYFQPSLNTKDVIEGWNLYEIPLAAYKGEKKVLIAFETKSEKELSLDNVSVVESPEKDLKIISFEPPFRMLASYDNKFKINIKNSGTKAATGYTIKLYKDSEVIVTTNGNELASGDSRDFTLTASFDITEIGKKYDFHIEVEYPGEELEVDNVSRTYSATVERSGYAGVPYMEGYYEQEKVFLEWDAPTSPKTPTLVEEGFEEYESFIINNIGEWTLIDGDGYPTVVFGGNIFSYWNYANYGEPIAYQVFNARQINPNSKLIPSWYARTGNQCLASIPHTQVGASDDWLISPELNGSSQEIVFFAKGVHPATTNPERFAFYYSMEGSSRTDFVKMTERDFQEAATDWQEYRYTLPEGAKHFAIQCVSEGAYSFLIDDISFLKAAGDINPVGYNVYRNNVKLNSEPVTTNQYEAPAPVDGEKNLYTVTAVYQTGESNQSAPFTVDFTNISTEVTNQINVYAHQGKLIIEGATEMEITIMTIEGQLVHKTVGKGNDEFAVSQGVYIIKTADKATKVIVR